MSASLSFIICTEKGYLEQMSLLFAMTLRTFGGSLASSPIYSFQPRPGSRFKPDNITLSTLKDLNVEHYDIPLNTQYMNYPFANKPLSAAYAEQHINSDFLVFIDSDQLILSEPTMLCLPDGYDIGLRPADRQNVATSGKHDLNYAYWKELYKILNVTNHSYVYTTLDQQRVLSYWNAGLVSIRKTSQLFSLWAKNFNKVMALGLEPSSRRFSDQTILSATVVSANANVYHFPNHYNYPIRRHNEVPMRMRINRLEHLATAHYHKMFLQLKPEHPLKHFLQDNEHNQKLRNLMDLSGVYPESVEAKKKYLQRIYAMHKAS